MKKSIFQKSLAAFLVAVMLLGTLAILPVSAVSDEPDTLTAAPEDDTAGDSETFGSLRTVEEIKKFLNTLSYNQYNDRYKDIPKAKTTVEIKAVDYDEEGTDANVEILSDYEGMKGDSLYMPIGGKTTWKVNIPDDGRYAMRITYYCIPFALEDKTEDEEAYVKEQLTTIERMMYIDGQLPFTESRYYYFPRVWEYQLDENGEFEKDRNGNDIRAQRTQAPEWQTYYLRDWLGYTMEPFQYYLTKGEHEITFDATREPMVLYSIELYPYEQAESFEDFIAEMKNKGITEVKNFNGEIVKVEAEKPYRVSNASLFPTNDRTSCLTSPQDPAVIKNNYLPSGTVNMWTRYKITVPEDGLYTVVTRYRQNNLIGMFVSRKVTVQTASMVKKGEIADVQYDEMNYCRFPYSTDWQSVPLTDGEHENLLVYLEKGDNYITFEPVLGEFAQYVYSVEQIIEKLNEAYQTIVKLTGPTPDPYRDYGFNRLVPDAIVTMGNSADDLYAIADSITELTGEKSDQAQALITYAELLEKMARDEYEVAPNLVALKNYVVSLSNWLYAMLSQPLKFDMFTVQGSEDEKPQAVANFFQGAWFEIRAFVMSFFMDYTTIDFKENVDYGEENTVEMWIANAAAGREDALIQRYLIDNYFTPKSGIGVTIKVITAGLQEAILAGIGPDVSNMGSTDTITWGLREAVEPLNDLPGFDEVVTWFDPEALVPLTLDNTTYGLPTSISFSMLFYRTDVLADVGIDIPTSWDQLYDVIPALQNSNLQMQMTTALNGFEIFIFQNGVDLYREDGLRINLDSNECLDAFESFCDMFTKYKCPVVEDVTRFRTGEIPIMIGDGIGTYNSLMGFYELRGLWEMAPLLGMKQADGTINRTSPITVSSMVMPRGSNVAATWEYMKWYVSEETQLRLARESLNVSGNPTTKVSTANKNAILKQAWTDYEYEAIETQLKSLKAVPEYPGNYITGTYVSAAFQEVYAKGLDASQELLDRVIYINKEISRKRREFRMDYYDLNSTQNGEWILIEAKNK